jgi:hypothetical protein
MIEKTLYRLAQKSYAIISIVFIVNFVTVFVLRLFIDLVPLWVTVIFFLITGIYVGYCIAHHSNRYLREENIRRNLSQN